jgi:DNA-binding MarR family transcriptional regulator
MQAGRPLSTLLSQVLVAFTIEFDNEFERRFVKADHEARFLVSLVMWANFMRFVGDGIPVGELPSVAGLPKARMLSTLGGMERWRYVVVGPRGNDNPEEAERDGWGSARGLRADWLVRPTTGGRRAREIWLPLFDEIERRWEERFGTYAIAELRDSLEAIVGQLDVELPEYIPVVAGSNGMAAGIGSLERRCATSGQRDPRLHLSALLSQALLGYTIDFERNSALSLPLSANVVRVVGSGVAVRELSRAAGVSAQAISMALTFLVKAGFVVVEADPGRTKLVRLTPKGLEARERSCPLHLDVQARWEARYGAGEVQRLGAALHDVLDRRDGDHAMLSRGLKPPVGGWRGSKGYLGATAAMIKDPSLGLPQYPMVLHRGGWPDGS